MNTQARRRKVAIHLDGKLSGSNPSEQNNYQSRDSNSFSNFNKKHSHHAAYYYSRVDANKMRTFAFNKADDIKELMSDFDLRANTASRALIVDQNSADSISKDKAKPSQNDF